MPRYNRSGKNLMALKIGRRRCMRQEYLVPGERIKPFLDGHVQITPLREQLALPVNLQLMITFVPMRYLEPTGDEERGNLRGNKWTEAVRNPWAVSAAPIGGSAPPTEIPWDSLGVGSTDRGSVNKYFVRAFNLTRFWHHGIPDYIKSGYNPTGYTPNIEGNTDRYQDMGVWPAESDIQTLRFGYPAVQLESVLTRWRNKSYWSDSESLTAEGTVEESGTTINIQEVAEFMARFKNETELFYEGEKYYNDALDAIWNGHASDNVNMVPWVLDDFDQWMDGRNMYATDGDNLGGIRGIMDFNIRHGLPFNFRAPEHGILQYWICLRFAPFYHGEANPFALGARTIGEMLANPSELETAAVRAYDSQDFLNADWRNDNDEIYYPDGEFHRSGWNSIDWIVGERNSFAHMNVANGSPFDSFSQHDMYSDGRMHPDMTHCFQSQAFADAFASVQFDQMVDSPIPDREVVLYGPAG